MTVPGYSVALQDHPFEERPFGHIRYGGSCNRCGLVRAVHPPSTLRPRDERSELALSAMAAEAVGVDDRSARSLEAFAQHRALPGGVRLRLDALREASEEFADGWNYLVWGAEHARDQMNAGDMGDPADDYARFLRALGYVHKAWAALHGA